MYIEEYLKFFKGNFPKKFMSINKPAEYQPWTGIGFIQNPESRIIGLLKDVRENAALLIPNFENMRLEVILDAIEKGELQIQEKSNPEKPQVELNYKLDLSQAKKIIDNYRNISEGGCEYCNNYTKSQNEEKNLTGIYCKAGETKDNINWLPIASNNSLKIREASRNHCPDRLPKLKPLDEIIKDYIIQEEISQDKN